MAAHHPHEGPGASRRATRAALAVPVLITLFLAGCAAPTPGVTQSAQTQTAQSDASIAQAGQTPPHLIGASAAVLRAALIAPVLRRHDGPADVWLYNSQLCRLEVVLYRGAGGNKLVSLAQPMPASVHLSACMASLQRNGTS